MSEYKADAILEQLLLDLVADGEASESLLAAWLIKTRAVNHRLIEELRTLREAR
jgi:hypothetical protein